MNERIKALRTALKMTQQVFGDKLGVVQNTVAQYESGRITPSSPVITMICNTFDVNEEWLRTGVGDMFIDRTYEEEINNFLSQVIAADNDDIRKRLTLYLARLKESDWERLDMVLDSILKGKDVLGSKKIRV